MLTPTNNPSPASTPTAVEDTLPGAPRLQRGSMVPVPWLGVANRLRGVRPTTHAPWQARAQALADAHPEAWMPVVRERRRWLLFWVLLSTAFAGMLLWQAQPATEYPVLQWAQMGLFALLFAWIAAGCVTAVMGAWVQWRGDRHMLSGADAGNAPIPDDARTAVIMPICNEDVSTVFAGLRATCESIGSTGWGQAFDVFVLSDTGRAELRTAELAAWQQLREDLAERSVDVRVYYRWRQRRTKRKSGNVADFCRRWGRAYRYMVVLDADSVMSGDTLVRLVRLMEKNPRAGILQTAPRACGLDTLHARAQQFAGRVTGRLFTAGMQFWQLGEAHYWGHNAIIRVEPFMTHCALAALPGTGALSGEILSHDFVEAALMRRAGYQVWLVGDLEGSYEQQPPHLLAELQRDRRWCMGNLQNARLIAEPGLKPVHRAMLFTGAMSYASAPLWLLYVALGTLIWALSDQTVQASRILAPAGSALLWLTTALMLMLPRVLGVVTVMLRGEAVQHGGALRLVASAGLESLLSLLQAPVRMAAHSAFVIGGLTGWTLQWKSPPREAEDLGWAQAAQSLMPFSLAAAAAMAAISAWAPTALPWLLPMALPLLVAVPVSVWTSQERLGRRIRRAGWLATPEESATPRVLRRAWALMREAVRFEDSLPADGLSRIARLTELAQAAVGPRRTTVGVRGRTRVQHLQKLDAESLDALLNGPEMLRLLSEPHSLRLVQLAHTTRSHRSA